MHLPRRMALGDVELGEVEVVGLDVGTFGDGEAHVGEDGGELVGHLADRMDAAGLRRALAHRQRDVDGLGVEALIERGALERLLAGGERGADAVLEAVDERALQLALVRRHGAERAQQRRHRAALAERRDAHGFQRRLVGRGGDVGQDLLFELLDVGHGKPIIPLSSSAKADDPVITERRNIGRWLLDARFRGHDS